MNEWDSEKMLASSRASFAPWYPPRRRNLVLGHTCSVREKGEHKLFSFLGTLRELKEERPELIIG